jgi:hypothetical protein
LTVEYSDYPEERVLDIADYKYRVYKKDVALYTEPKEEETFEE